MNILKTNKHSRIRGNYKKMKKLTLLFLAITLLAFTVGDSKSEYLVPSGSVSVFSADLDLDNYNDIVVGSNIFPYTNWGGYL